MEKIQLSDFSLEELKAIKEEITNCENINEVVEKIDLIIAQKNDEYDINKRFDMAIFEEFNIFPPTELAILKKNGIQNLAQLHDADLGTFKYMTESSKEYIDWARNFYYFKITPQQQEKKSSTK